MRTVTVLFRDKELEPDVHMHVTQIEYDVDFVFIQTKDREQAYPRDVVFSIYSEEDDEDAPDLLLGTPV